MEYEAILDEPDAYNKLPSVYQLIAKIRLKARKNFPNERFENYHYAVAAYNCRLLKATTLSEEQKGILVCAILTSLEKLNGNKRLKN